MSPTDGQRVTARRGARTGAYRSVRAIATKSAIVSCSPRAVGSTPAASSTADAVLDTKSSAYVRYKDTGQFGGGDSSAAVNGASQKTAKSELTQQWTKSNIQGLDAMNGCELSAFQKIQSMKINRVLKFTRETPHLDNG